MKVSFILEALLICILIAFAASAVIGEPQEESLAEKAAPKKYVSKQQKRQQSGGTNNRFCSCSAKLCNCCREFNIPVVSLQGPGCASLQYLKGDRLAIAMSFGERVLSNTTISGRRPQPVCVPLPGGVSKFCGRVYNIGRKGDDFRACLGLELRTLEDIEATLRVSCFRFGPNGLRVEPPQPLPIVEEEVDNTDDEDEDEDDDYEFSLDDDDDYEGDSYNDVEEDYTTFSLLDDDFIDEYLGTDSSSEGNKKKVTKKRPAQVSTKVQRKPTKGKVSTKTRPVQLRKKAQMQSTEKPITAIEVADAVNLNGTQVEKVEQTQDQKISPEHSTNETENAVINSSEIQEEEKLNATSVELDSMLNNNEMITETELGDTIVASTIKYTSEEQDSEEDESEPDSEEDSDEDDTDVFSEVVGEIVEDEIEDSPEKVEPKTKTHVSNKKNQ